MSGEDNNEYICLINEEEQYSIWYAWKKIPIGWKKVGPTGSKQDVLDYINKVWTDMRPKSLRDSMDKKYNGPQNLDKKMEVERYNSPKR